MMRRKQHSSSSSSSSFWHSRSRSASAPATPRAADPPLGCMSMVHYLIFAPGAGCVGRPPASSANVVASAAVVAPSRTSGYDRHDNDDGVEGKGRNRGGVEAPRNSLDLDADNLDDIQIGVQIEPAFDALALCRNTRTARATEPSSETATPRTPSLVARLMGIDGLPDDTHQSPSAARRTKPTTSRASAGLRKDEQQDENVSDSPAASSAESTTTTKKKRVIPESVNRREPPLRRLSCNVHVGGTGACSSLPDTPRASASARASWDGARLSLQALKESVLDRAEQYMSLPTSPTSAGTSKSSNKKKKDARRTAKEIVRQARENVATRRAAKERQRVMVSSANTPDNKENVSPVAVVRKDKMLLPVGQAQARGKPTAAVVVPSPQAPQPPKAQQCKEEKTPVVAPRRVALAPKHPPPPPPPQRVKPSRPPPPPPPLDTPAVRAKKPDGCERFATRIKKPASSSSSSSSPQPAPPRASAAPSAPAASASRSECRGTSDRLRCPSVPLEEDPEYGYLLTVLERGGFMRTSPSRGFKGRSVASPVDPIVFHLLELELPADEARLGPLRHRWNRKLMFHLAQEILADLLLDLESGSSSFTSSVLPTILAAETKKTAELPRGAALLPLVWKRARSFPAADCRVVGDIDALVATDLESSRVRRLARHPAVAEEAGDVAEEVAERVLETLLGECVAEESLSLSSHYSSRSSPARAHPLAVGGGR